MRDELDLEVIRKRWWLNDPLSLSATLWGVEDVRALIDEVERLKAELAALRKRSETEPLG